MLRTASPLNDFMKKIKMFFTKNIKLFLSKCLCYIIKNHLILIGFSLTLFSIWYSNIHKSDIRVTRTAIENKFNFKLIERCIDKTNNKLIYYCSIRPTFKNKSFKSGHIDMVELVPLSACPLPETKVIYINKQEIGGYEEKEIEIYFIIIMPVYSNDQKLKLNEIKIELFLHVLDSSGKQIDQFTDGEFVRMVTVFWAK